LSENEAENLYVENPIKPYDGTWDPEWNTYRIYTLVDILNSPMREIYIAKKLKEKK